MQIKPGWRKFVPWSAAGAAVLFVILWAADFPEPNFDDLFLCGAAFNLAAGGDFSNPLLARQEFPGHFYFMHTPLHSYALAGWLKLFGISAAAVLGFQMALYILTAWATIAILRRHAAPAWLEWLAPLGVSATLLPQGIRHEALSIALTMAGFAIIECGYRRRFPVFLAFVLMFLGGSVTPRLVLFSAALIFFAGYRLWQSSSGSGWRRVMTFRIPVIAALLFSCGLLLWLIDFRLAEFYRVFRYHAAGKAGEGMLKMLAPFVFAQRSTVWPMWGLFIGLLVLAARKSRNDLDRLGLLLACAFPIAAAASVLGRASAWYMVLAICLLGTSLLKTVPRKLAIAIAVAFCAAFPLANVKIFLKVAGVAGGQIRPDLGQEAQKALALRPTPEHPLLVDSGAARYLYDYRLPPGCISIECAAPFPEYFVTSADLRNGDIYVLGDYNTVLGLERDTYLKLGTDMPKWNPVGLKKWAFDKYPQRIFIITAEECKAVRPETAAFTDRQKPPRPLPTPGT